MPEFDWYGATVRAPVDDVLEALGGLAEGLLVSHRKAPGRAGGYGSLAVVGNARHGDVARVFYGGRHEYPHAAVSGHWAPPGAQLIRAVFPEHSVARLDVKEDFEGVGTYDVLQAELVAIATRRKLKVDARGDHLVTKLGRSVYIGSRKSDVFSRLYDKAEEMRSKVTPPVHDVDLREYYAGYGIPEYLTRFEAQVSPHTREAKAAFAVIEPVEVLGSAAWLREFWKGISGLELSPVKVGKGWRPSDDSRAFSWMCKLNQRLLREMAEDCGSYECLGLMIRDEIRRLNGKA